MLQKIFIFILLTFLTANLSFSEVKGKISGKVADEKDNTPIEADVKLYSGKDTTILTGTSCDPNGNFIFENLHEGKYRIELSFIGYSSLKIDNISISNDKVNQYFDTLTLKRLEIQTEEILVEKEKGILNIVGDKKVFNVDKSILTKGGTAVDVLKKVPLVDVDQNDNVSLRGSQNVKILIDDKPNKYASLKQLPSDIIEKVEVITNPSAKYEAEGVTGIINIVLKKNNKLGFNGNSNISLGTKDKYNGGLNLNSRKNAWSMFSGLYGGIFNMNFLQSGISEYSAPVVSSIKFEGNGSVRNRYYNISGGLENELFKGNSLGVEGTFNKGEFSQYINSDNYELDYNGLQTGFYKRENTVDGKWQYYSAGLYYNGNLDDKGRELTGNFTVSGNKMEFSSLLEKAPLKQNDHTNNKSTNVNAQLDYTHPFSPLIKLETGYKGTFRINDNDFSSDTLDNQLNYYVRNYNSTNHFRLSERINAFYLVASGALNDNLSYKLGIRAEHTYTNGELYNSSLSFKKSYLDFFPSVYLTYKISPSNNLQASYSRRITRPGIFRLNPFKMSYDPKYVIFGNPNLNPEFTDSYELSYVLITNYFTVTPLAFYRVSRDVMSTYTFTDSNNVAYTTYLNASGSKAYGLDIILSSNALSWMNLNGTLSFYNTKFEKDAVSEYAQEEGFSWKANIRSTITAGSLFNLELYYNYTGKRINAQGTTNPRQNFDIGISKSFLDDNLTVSLKVNDIFKTMNNGYETNSSGYKFTIDNNFDMRALYLNVSYTFGNTQDKVTKKKKIKQNSNESNDQQDNNLVR